MALERGYDEIAAILRGEEQKRPASLPSKAEDSRPITPDQLSAAYGRGDEDRVIAILMPIQR